MATPTLLTTGRSSSNPTSTASISPTANRWIYVCVTLSTPGGWQTTAGDALAVSGCNLTWEQVGAVPVWGFRRGSYVWRGKGASPSSGALSITFTPSQGQFEEMEWVVVDMVGIDETTPNGTVVTADGVAGSWAASGLGTPDSGDLSFVFVGLEDNVSITWNAETDTEIAQSGDSVGARRIGVAYDSAPDSTPAPGGSWTSTSYGGIAFILNAAAGGGTPQELSGTIEADSAASASIRVEKQAAGLIAAESAASGAASVDKRLAGSSPAASSVSGALVQDTRLAAAAVAESSVEGGILQSVELAGAVTAQSTVAGAAQQDTRLAGIAASISGVSGELDSGGVALAGVVASESAAVGALQVEHPLAGAAVATSEVSAWLSAGGAELEGDVAGQSAVAGSLSVHRSIAGRVDAAATPAGAVEVARALAGRVSAAGAAAGSASAAKYLAAYAAALSAVAGDLVIGQIAHEILAGVADSCRVIESWGDSRREIDAEADSAGALTDWAK